MDETPTLSRRHYLALAGTGLAGLAGCGGGDGPTPGSENDRPTTARTPGSGSNAQATTSASTATPTRTAAPTPAETDAPTPTRTDTPTSTRTATPTPDLSVSDAEASLADLSFEGSWFDTHAHWRMAAVFDYDDYATDALTARQREHGVGATVLFVPHEPFRNRYGRTVRTLASETVDYLPFLYPGGFHSAEERASYYADNEAVYHGLGEVTFYSGSERGRALTDAPFPQYFRLSADAGIPLMLHPTEQQAGDVGPMLLEYPEASLLLHGHEMLGTDVLPRLLRDHDNLYWTYDTATMLGGAMVTSRGKSDFLRRLRADREGFLRRVTRRLPRLLEAAPEQVMWGTDVVADWHVDPAVYGELISFSEDVLDALPATHREPFAHGNAVALFGG